MKDWTLRKHGADDGSVYWSLVSNDHDIHIAMAHDTPGLWVAVWMHDNAEIARDTCVENLARRVVWLVDADGYADLNTERAA